MQIGPFELLPAAKTISGGVPASRQETVQMLDFVARTGIRPMVQTYPMSEINEAVAQVRSGRAHYRAVVTT
ncbi:hypothetical protein [Mycolicibacterium iranicum]|uniref:hypothetical protein n=1 Tax=Mycolicibacterium iranicum TaxID=912594 RepID=UPI0026867989